MKAFLPFFFLLLFLGVFSCKDPAPSPPSFWAETYGGTQEDWAFSILLDKNGDQNFFVFGRSGGDASFRLYNINSFGSVIWEKSYLRYEWSFGESMTQLADGGLLLAGTAGFFSGGSESWLVRVDALGEYVWEKAYKDEDQNFTQSILEDSQGEFVVTASSGPQGGVIANLRIFKVDMDGNLLADNRVVLGRKNGQAIVVERPEGGYMLAASGDDSTGMRTDMRVYQLDQQLQVERMVSFSDDVFVDVQDLIITQSGDYALLGTHDENSWLIMLDKDLNKKWETIYAGYPRAMTQDPDGAFALTGYQNDNLILRKIGNQGSPMWLERYGGLREDLGEDIITLPDGGYAIAGATASSGAGAKDFWVLKLNSLGEYR